MNHVNILTRDLEASKAFYSDILGANYCYNLGPRKAVMSLTASTSSSNRASRSATRPATTSAYGHYPRM